MSKGTLTFDLQDPEDRANFKKAVHANDAYLALWDIAQEIFRPARKHGYDDPRLNELLQGGEKVEDAIGMLETKFYAILEGYGVDINE